MMRVNQRQVQMNSCLYGTWSFSCMIIMLPGYHIITCTLQSSGITQSTSHLSSTHIVQDVGPALHGDALEHGQHRQAEVVEVGDAEVGPLPVRRTIVPIGTLVAGAVSSTWHWLVNHTTCQSYTGESSQAAVSTGRLVIVIQTGLKNRCKLKKRRKL